MTVLEGNQAYRAAMKILWEARLAAQAECDAVIHYKIIRIQERLTEQETRDMDASSPRPIPQKCYWCYQTITPGTDCPSNAGGHETSSPTPRRSFYNHVAGQFELEQPYTGTVISDLLDIVDQAERRVGL